MSFIIRVIHRLGIIELFLLFFLCVNLTSFWLYFIDKKRSHGKKMRISEKTLILFTLLLGGIGAFLGMFSLRHKTKKPKFRVAVTFGLVIALIPIIHIGHSLTLDRIIRYVEIDFSSPNWPVELNGYRIGFMTDFHKIPHERMAEVVDNLNARELDLLLLGGDFSVVNSHYVGTLREISKTQTADGIFGVEGNHDNYTRLFEAKKNYGIGILDNDGLRIRDGFYLAGIRDFWRESANIGKALEYVDTDAFVLLVTHNPDALMKESTVGIDLVVAGHTHGGQISLFGFPIYLLLGSVSDYRTRFSNGFNTCNDGVLVYTSKGIGDYYNWPRIFARPEVIIFTMFSE